MKKQKTSIAYVGGGVNFKMEDWDKTFRPGNKLKFHVSSNMKIRKVSYCWNNGKRIKVKTKKNNCDLKVKIPKGVGDLPEILIITEVKLPSGIYWEFGRRFQINNVF